MQVPAQAGRDRSYLGPRSKKLPLKFDTMHMYRVTIEAMEAQAGIRLWRGPTKEQEAATSLEAMLPRRYREVWSQQMAEISRKRRRAVEEGRDTAIRRCRDRENQCQNMWP